MAKTPPKNTTFGSSDKGETRIDVLEQELESLKKLIDAEDEKLKKLQEEQKLKKDLTNQEIARLDILNKQKEAKKNLTDAEITELEVLIEKQKIKKDLLDQEVASLKFLDENNKKYKELNNRIQRLKKAREEELAIIKKELKSFDEIDASMASIAKFTSKSGKSFEIFEKATSNVQNTIKGIDALMADVSVGDQKQITNYLNSLKETQTSINQAYSGLTQRNISEEEYNQIVKQQTSNLTSLFNTLNLSTDVSEKLAEALNNSITNITDFGKASEGALTQMTLLDESISILGTNVPGLQELKNVFKNLNSDSILLKGSVFALGAALGNIFGQLALAGPSAGIQAFFDRMQTEIDRAREVGQIENEFQFVGKKAAFDKGQIAIDAAKEAIKIESDFQQVSGKIDLERSQNRIDSQNEINRLTIDAAYASQRAANQFSAEMQSGAASFQAAAKTALFGDKLGGVGYGAAQLQLAGVGAEKIAEQMATAGDVMGKMPTSRIAADMAVMSTRTGASSEAIAQLTKSFMLVDGVSQQTALNLQEGMRAMATAANIPLNTLMQDVAEASKEMIGYQIRSTSALASQVAFTKSIGVNFNEIAKAGRSMVLNYKDSIKSEMQLSAILGRNVDLSEVRSKFASGDVKGAIEALKAQGLNPEEMGMFEQEALSQALGGIDLASLRNIATQTGKNVGLGEGNVAAANQQFLSRTQSAQATLNSQQAQISAQQAIIDAQLSAKITDAYLNSDGYKNYQAALALQAIEQTKYNALLAKNAIDAETNNKNLQDALKSQQVGLANLQAEITTAFQKTEAYRDAIAESARLGLYRSVIEGILPAITSLLGGWLATMALGKFGAIPVKITGGGDFGGGAGGFGGQGGGKPTTRPTTQTTQQPFGGVSRSPYANPPASPPGGTSVAGPTQSRTTLKSGSYVEGGVAYSKSGKKLTGAASQSVLNSAEKIKTTTPSVVRGGKKGGIKGTLGLAHTLFSMLPVGGGEGEGGLEMSGMLESLSNITSMIPTSMSGGVGKFAKGGAKLLGKLAWPIQIATSLYDAYEGFNVDKTASITDKFKNAGNNLLSGLTFGLLGKNAEGIKANKYVNNTAPSTSNISTQMATGMNIAPMQPVTQMTTGVNFAPIQPMAQMTTGMNFATMQPTPITKSVVATSTQPAPPMTKGVDVKPTP
jgi:hypothetical protein